MTTLDLGKYFDECGSAVLASEFRLRNLGLNVLKSPVGTLQRPSGVVLDLYDLAFERRDENFSAELVDFLQKEIKLSTARVRQVEQQAVHRQ